MTDESTGTGGATAAAAASKARRADLWKALGPGILVACAAIGGSHLVWSTRAGAEFGSSLLGLILLANLFKFPFFLYGQRYTAATRESLLAGYRRQGIGYLYVFLLVNILTGIINIAGVSMLSGALFAGYGSIGMGVPGITIGILLVCMVMILLGHYKLLDGVSKVVIILLALTTFVAVALAWRSPTAVDPAFHAPSPWTWASLPFLVSLLGWMPAPVDLSAWSSLWMFSRHEQTKHFATTRETTIDFYLGYVMAVVLAVAFVALGKLVMFGSGEAFSNSGIAFSNQLVTLYSANIGDWSRPLILTAAFVTMFSTTITCVDGYPRSLAACWSLLGSDHSARRFQQIHRYWIILSVTASSLIVFFFVKNLLQLLSFAAMISFVTSPVLAYINYRVMNGANVPEQHRPGLWMKTLSWTGLLFFLVMSVGFVYVEFFRG